MSPPLRLYKHKNNEGDMTNLIVDDIDKMR